MRVTVDGRNYHCRVEGPATAPAVVFSHALATELRVWEPQVAALRARYRLVRFDTLGHGGTDAPEGPYSLEGLARDTLALMDALKIERAGFVGLSLGGMIAQELALQAPERLACLVLCSTTSRIPPEAGPLWSQRIRTAAAEGMEPLVAPTIVRWFTRPFRERRPDVVEAISAMIRATPPAGYIGCCRAIMHLDLTERLGAVRLPTLIVVGEEDQGTPVSASQAIHERIAGSRLEVIPAAAHLCNVERADEINRLLLDFLPCFL